MNRCIRRLAALAVVWLALPLAAHADWPDKPVKLVVASPPAARPT